jgi:hypothetical protein
MGRRTGKLMRGRGSAATTRGGATTLSDTTERARCGVSWIEAFMYFDNDDAKEMSTLSFTPGPKRPDPRYAPWSVPFHHQVPFLACAFRSAPVCSSAPTAGDAKTTLSYQKKQGGAPHRPRRPSVAGPGMNPAGLSGSLVGAARTQAPKTRKPKLVASRVRLSAPFSR